MCHPHSISQHNNNGVISPWHIYYPFQYDLIRQQLNLLPLLVRTGVDDDLVQIHIYWATFRTSTYLVTSQADFQASF